MTPQVESYLSWGRAHRYPHRALSPAFAADAQREVTAAAASGLKLLPYGLGRSYGDSCLNDSGVLVDTRALDRFVDFDAVRGEIECEAGVSLADILDLLMRRPAGEPSWFLPVTPGTKWVTVGGAIANDVHGKSHHHTGTFGSHVRSLRLLRSDGIVRDCSPSENQELFAATIGGLGLTGLVLSARLALMPVPGFDLACEDIRYDDLDAFFRLSEESREDWQYTVAWIDCLAPRASLGRGVFSRARHSDRSQESLAAHASRLAVPFDAPSFLLSRPSVRAFNALRWRRFSRTPRLAVRPFDPVLYPLDGIGHWNRLYGARGFYQYQCVVPHADAQDRIAQLLARVTDSGQSAFLAVLKVFGDKPSPGILSFPMPGATLALDLPHRGASTLALMDELDAVVRDAGGRVYPAKDGRMSAEDFRSGYPRGREFARHVDPAFSSSFWRRVSA